MSGGDVAERVKSDLESHKLKDDRCCGEGSVAGKVLGEMGAFEGYFPVTKLVQQFQFDNCFSFGIFILTCALSAAFAPYWRPIYWDCFWIVLAILIVIQGHVASQWLSSFGLVAYLSMVLLLGAMNMAHLLALRSEHVRTCAISQREFIGCYDEPSLQECFLGSRCTKAQIAATDCTAAGAEHCDAIDGMNIGFAVNLLISFVTFSEPAWWATLLFIRLEGARMATRTPQEILNGKDVSAEQI